jgi:hypothetical protein
MNAIRDTAAGTPLARARALDPAWYTDPARLAREREAVFARSWHGMSPATTPRSSRRKPGPSALAVAAARLAAVVSSTVASC